MTNASKFQRGSGCYTCGYCGRRTRSTGRGDNENCGLCAECYDLSGLENEASDRGMTPALEAEMEALRVTIRSKGGVL
jgi:hypothetical protein